MSLQSNFANIIPKSILHRPDLIVCAVHIFLVIKPGKVTALCKLSGFILGQLPQHPMSLKSMRLPSRTTLATLASTETAVDAVPEANVSDNVGLSLSDASAAPTTPV